jgi:hypothetical protein
MTSDSDLDLADSSLIHIGLPKAASSALQRFFLPELGLPYDPYPGKHLPHPPYLGIRYDPNYVAPPYTGRRIVSGEALSDPGGIGTAEIARRFHETFKNAIVLVIVRDPLDHFISSYREQLSGDINLMVEMQREAPGKLAAKPPAFAAPSDINVYFERSRQGGLGYFRVADLDRNLAGYSRFFPVLIVDYSLIVKNFALFADIVCGALGLPRTITSLPVEHKSDVERFAKLVAQLSPDMISTEERQQLIANYQWPNLAPDRRQLLLDFYRERCAETFSKAVFG